jgi:tripartite-type tricarboxylate transporter receptor subunit TctC
MIKNSTEPSAERPAVTGSDDRRPQCRRHYGIAGRHSARQARFNGPVIWWMSAEAAMHRRSLIRSAAAAGLLPAAVGAQSFSPKQLRFIVSTPPAGGMDIVARILAQELTRSAGLSVLVDNKPGGRGAIATREALRAPADGHTILLAGVGILAVNPYTMTDAGYSPNDISPVCLAVDFSNVLVVHPSVPARTLAEYLELGRRPEGIDYGTSGIGSAGHLAGELLRVRSGAPAMNDLVAGHLASVMASGPSASNFVREGHVRALALTGAYRTPLDPDVPTIVKSGFPGYAATNWYAFVVSSKVPREIVAEQQPISPANGDMEEAYRRRRHPDGMSLNRLFKKDELRSFGCERLLASSGGPEVDSQWLVAFGRGV